MRFSEIARSEAAGGVVLLLATAIALAWANSPYAGAYVSLLERRVPLGAIGSPTVHFLVNDALMAVFFLVVGIEIRREMRDGALASLGLAALPLVAALGGVLAPAALYLALNAGGAGRSGWAIPTATDIAFAVGVLALLGRSVPSNLRVLLLALAVIDDIAAVLIIAAFYSAGFEIEGLAWIGAAAATVVVLRRLHARPAWICLAAGLPMWAGSAVSAAAGLALGRRVLRQP